MFYKQLTPAQRERVEKLLARGKQSFVWRRGVLGWGLPVFAMTTVWRYIGPLHLHTGKDVLFSVTMIMLPLWLIGGYFFGVSMWQYYIELLASQRN